MARASLFGTLSSQLLRAELEVGSGGVLSKIALDHDGLASYSDRHQRHLTPKLQQSHARSRSRNQRMARAHSAIGSWRMVLHNGKAIAGPRMHVKDAGSRLLVSQWNQEIQHVSSSTFGFVSGLQGFKYGVSEFCWFGGRLFEQCNDVSNVWIRCQVCDVSSALNSGAKMKFRDADVHKRDCVDIASKTVPEELPERVTHLRNRPSYGVVDLFFHTTKLQQEDNQDDAVADLMEDVAFSQQNQDDYMKLEHAKLEDCKCCKDDVQVKEACGLEVMMKQELVSLGEGCEFALAEAKSDRSLW